MNINKHDLSDDELDHLFRDSSEKMDFDFEPDSWTKMSQKLDAVNLPASGENQAKNVWLKRGLSILLALLFIIGGYYVFTPSSKQATTTLQTKQKNNSGNEIKDKTKKHVTTDKVDTDDLKNNVSESPSSSEKIISGSESVVYDSKKAENKINISSKLEEKESVLVNKKIENTSKPQKNKIVKNKNSAKLLVNQAVTTNTKSSKTKNLTVDEGNEDLANKIPLETSSVENVNDVSKVSGKTKKGVKSQKLKVNTAINDTQIPSNSDISNQISTNQGIGNVSQPNLVAANAEENTDRWQLGDIKNLAPKNGIFKAYLQLPAIVFESPKAKLIIPISSRTSFQKGLYLRAAISPDFSVVLSNSFAKIGNNGAFLLEYRFNEHWSLHSGVIRSLKRYIATPEQYNWNTSWNYPTPLTFVDATCKMLDIPLNVRYDITQKSNSRLYVSSGFTSYIMLKEDYYYNYKDNTNPNIKYREWSTKSGNYPFSVLNFSLGYERQILRKLSLQAEPFIKIPLGEVGYGKVKLSTIGVFISAKYPIARF